MQSGKNCLTGRAPLPDGLRAFGAMFEALACVQIEKKWACWKGL